VRRFVAVRLLHASVVLFVVATIAFFLIHAAPGDPFALDNTRMPTEVREHLMRQFGYDRPLVEQYVRYLGNLARGELGYSHMLQVPVATVLATAVPRTLALMTLALLISFSVGIATSLFEVRRAGTRAAKMANAVTLLLFSVPSFWLALMLLLAFAYWVPILPAGGLYDMVVYPYMDTGEAILDRLRHLALPLLSLTLVSSAAVARYQRATLMEVLPSEFVRTARAKGLDERSVIHRHVLRNALLPIIALAGLTFPSLIGGAVFVERVFSWPGMGLMVTSGIAARDYSLVMAVVLIGAVMVVIGNLLADIGQGLADPRARVH
jgi:peptide/nickel transport system permease protein